MPATFSYDEMNITADITADHGTIVREGKVAWSDLDAVMLYLFPPTIGTSVNAGVSYPGAGFEHFRAQSLHIEPFIDHKYSGPDSSQDFDTVMTFTFAKITVRYETIEHAAIDFTPQPIDNDPVPMLHHRWTLGGEFLTLEAKVLRWCDSTGDEAKVSDQVRAGIFIPTEQHHIQWPRIVKPPFRAIKKSLGKVNDAEFENAMGLFEKETLLFLGCEASRDVLTNGERAWNIAYHFSYKRVTASDGDNNCNVASSQGDPLTRVGGWNHFWRSQETRTDECKGGFYRIHTCNSDPIYESVDFAPLFQPGP